jgi:UDPglucose--hexose-1-phosphate uridylyltransferase
MDLRKDPITRSWVITGDDVPDRVPRTEVGCRFCPGATNESHIISSMPGLEGAPWSALAVVHPSPLYHIEGEPGRRGDGIYDQMRPIGAHEVLLENPIHGRNLWNASDREVEKFLLLAAQRIQDLKRDQRFKYVSVFKNHGTGAAQEFEHPHSQITATTFVPRRVLYELRAGRDYFENKERCVFCDILSQEQRQGLRVLEVRGDFVASCPYAPRVPYETWILPRVHDAAFERSALSRAGGMLDLAALLRRTLTRIRSITEQFHLVLHTSPNSTQGSETLGYWKTLDDDYHWHIEILPILPATAKSYTFKEVYYSPVSSESAAARLRNAQAD